MPVFLTPGAPRLDGGPRGFLRAWPKCMPVPCRCREAATAAENRHACRFFVAARLSTKDANLHIYNFWVVCFAFLPTPGFLCAVPEFFQIVKDFC